MLGLFIFIGRYCLGKNNPEFVGRDRGIQECLACLSSLEEIVWENLNPEFTGKDRGVQECLARLSSLEEIVSKKKNTQSVGEKTIKKNKKQKMGICGKNPAQCLLGRIGRSKSAWSRSGYLYFSSRTLTKSISPSRSCFG